MTGISRNIGAGWPEVMALIGSGNVQSCHPSFYHPFSVPVERLIGRAMSDRLARAEALAFEAEEIYDEVPEHSPRQQLTSSVVSFRTLLPPDISDTAR
jgi:hypothetical protein